LLNRDFGGAYKVPVKPSDRWSESTPEHALDFLDEPVLPLLPRRVGEAIFIEGDLGSPSPDLRILKFFFIRKIF